MSSDDPREPTEFHDLADADMDLPVIAAGEAQMTMSRLLDQLVHSLMLVEATAMSLARALDQGAPVPPPSGGPARWAR